MSEPPSNSILLLELEELKEHMFNLQVQEGQCMVSLQAQSEVVCDVLARLETVAAIVKASEMVQSSCSHGVIRRNVDSVSNIGDALKKERIFELGENGVGQDYLFIDHDDTELLKGNHQTDENPESLEAKSLDQLNTSQGMSISRSNKDSDDKTAVLVRDSEDSVVADEANDVHVDCIDNGLYSTRPSLSRKYKMKGKETKKNIPDNLYYQITPTVATACITISASSCPVPSSSKMSLPNSVTSCKTSSSMKIAMISTVNKVKEICKNLDWKLEGSYSSREGKEGCKAVHFYKLRVKGGVTTDILVRGVGGSKREAVRGAFKTMESRLVAVDLENQNTEEMLNKEDLCENNVNFLDPDSSSIDIDSPSPPPVFYVKDCVTGLVEKRLAVSDSDAGAIIGTNGSKINKITKETRTRITVGGLVGRNTRMVDLRGEKRRVDEALKMIQELIKK